MSQLGRISGPLLKNNLIRNGVDLAFETDLLYLDVNNKRIGINVTDPLDITADLTVNGLIRTGTIDITSNNVDIGNINISGNTITSNSSILNLAAGGNGLVVYQSKLLVDDIRLENNTISTTASNASLELRPHGTGTVEIFGDTNVTGTITATGNIRADGNIQIGSENQTFPNNDTVTFNAKIDSDIIPAADDVYSLGNTDFHWKDMWVKNLYSDTLSSGSLIIDGINLALPQGNIIYVAANGKNTNSGTHQNDPLATITQAIAQAVAGDNIYVYPGRYEETFPLTIPAGVVLRGSGIRSVFIYPTASTMFLNAVELTGETTVEDCTFGNFYHDTIAGTGHAFAFQPGGKITTRSPYIRNISVITKGTASVLAINSIKSEVINSIDRIKSIIPDIVTNTAITKTLSNPLDPVNGPSASDGTTGILLQGLIDDVTYIINNGTLKANLPSISANGTAATTGSLFNAAAILTLNKEFIKEEAYAYITTTYSPTVFDPVSIKRDINTIVDAMIYDIVRGGNEHTVYAGLSYWSQPANDPRGYARGDAGPGIDADGSVLDPTSNEAGMLFSGVTFIVPGSDALTATGGARIEWLNSFTYYAKRSMYLYSSPAGFAGVGKTRLKINSTTGTWAVGDTLSYYDTDGITVLASGVIESIDGAFYNIGNYVLGFETLADTGATSQDLRTSAGGTATAIDFADYSDFGVELRSIGSASVYGEYGIYGDGDGVIAYLIGHNFAYVGNGSAASNDPNSVIQANEIVELNKAHLYFQSIDHKGDFRIGDLFYVNQQTGEATFTNSAVTIGNSLTFDDGLGNVTYLDATKIETGDFRISGNTIETLTQDFNILAASNKINLQSDVSISGSLDVSGNITIGGNLTIGDQTTDTVSFVAGVSSDIIPTTNSAYDLGSSSFQWKGIYSTALNVGGINITSNVITTVESNSNLELRANGTGTILAPTNDVQVDQNLTVNGTTNTADLSVTGTITHVGDVQQTGSITQTGVINVTGSIDISGDAQFNDILISGNTVATTVANNDLNLSANGTGKVIVPTADVVINNDLTVNGLASINSLTTTNTVTANAFSTGDVVISQNYITTTQTNSNLELLAHGTGKIYVPNNNVQLDQQLTVVGTTNTANVTIVGTVNHTGDTTQTGDLVQTGDFTLTGNLTVDNTAQFKDINIDNNVITTTIGNNNLELLASGTGRVLVPSNDVEIAQGLTVTGVTSTTTINNTGTVTSTAFSTGDITVTGNTLGTSVSNSNLELVAAGAGKVSVPLNDVAFGQNLEVAGTTTLSTTSITGTLTHVGNVVQSGDTAQTGDYVLTGNLTVDNTAQFKDVQIDNNIITTTVGNNDLVLQAAGTGRVVVPSNNVLANQTLTVLGTTTANGISNTGTVTSTAFSTGDITVSSNVVTTTITNSDLELRASGTGRIYVPTNNVQIDQALTVVGLTTLGNTTIVGTINHTGNTTQVGDVTQTGAYQLNGNLTVDGTVQLIDVQIDNNVITTTLSNSNLELRAAGTGKIVVPSNNVVIDQNLTVTGTTTTTNINNSGTVTATTFSDGDITISGNLIRTTATNSNLQLSAAGTGFIELEQFEIQDNTIRISAADTNLVLQPNGTGIVSINSTQALKIPVGDTTQRPTAAAGMIRFNSELTRYEGYNGTTWVRLDGVEDADGNTKITAELTPGANDNTIRFFTNGTQVADLTSARFNVNSLTSGNINVTDNVISTTGIDQNLVLTPNGTGSVRTGNFAFKDSTITNTVNNSITNINHTGNGYFKINSTGGFVIPTGLTEQRPPLFAVGMMRYNTDPGNFRVEIWDGANWVNAGQGAGGGVSLAEAQDIGIVSAIIFG